jgi:hypothetical protein
MSEAYFSRVSASVQKVTFGQKNREQVAIATVEDAPEEQTDIGNLPASALLSPEGAGAVSLGPAG